MKTLLLGVLLACGPALGCSSTSTTLISGNDSGSATDGTSPPQDSSTAPEAGGDDSTAPLPEAGGLDSSQAMDTSTGVDSGTGLDGGADSAGDTGVLDASCGSTPTLHPGSAGSIYCGFTDAGALTCAPGQECCLGGMVEGGTFDPQECAGFGTACTNGGDPDAGGSLAIPIACAQVSDCIANGVSGAAACCLQGAMGPAVPPGCSYPKATYGTAIACETTACGAGEITMCSSQADCPQGTTCTPGKWKIYQVGFCL